MVDTVKGKITTIPKDIDYIEHAIEFGDTGIQVVDLMDANGVPIPSDTYVYPTHTRKEKLLKMRTQDSKMLTAVEEYEESLSEHIRTVMYDGFVYDLNDMLQKISERGINVYIHADQEVGIRSEDVSLKHITRQDTKKVTFWFDYMIEDNDAYKYYFLNGVDDQSIDMSCRHAKWKVNEFIKNLRPKLS